MVDINVKIDVPVATKLLKIAEKLLVDSWLKPLSIWTEGRAHIKVEAHKMLELDKVNKQIAQNQSAHLEHTTACLSKTDFSVEMEQKKEAEFNHEQKNITGALAHAINEATDDGNSSSKILNDDWLFRWKDYAGKVSSDDMQKMWGRVLSGEVNDPGRYSYKTLEALNSLSTKDAELFIKFASCAIYSNDRALIVMEESVLNSVGLTYEKIMDLAELGLIYEDAKTYNFQLSSSGQGVLTNFHHYGFVLSSRDGSSEKAVVLPILAFTRSGRDLFELARPEANITYFESIAQMIADSNELDVLVADLLPVGDSGSYHVFNEKAFPFRNA